MGLGAGLYEKSVLYLLILDNAKQTPDDSIATLLLGHKSADLFFTLPNIYKIVTKTVPQ